MSRPPNILQKTSPFLTAQHDIKEGKEEYLYSAILADTPLTKRSEIRHVAYDHRALLANIYPYCYLAYCLHLIYHRHSHAFTTRHECYQSCVTYAHAFIGIKMFMFCSVAYIQVALLWPHVGSRSNRCHRKKTLHVPKQGQAHISWNLITRSLVVTGGGIVLCRVRQIKPITLQHRPVSFVGHFILVTFDDNLKRFRHFCHRFRRR